MANAAPLRDTGAGAEASEPFAVAVLAPDGAGVHERMLETV
jgi:hypothetical protein